MNPAPTGPGAPGAHQSDQARSRSPRLTKWKWVLLILMVAPVIAGILFTLRQAGSQDGLSFFCLTAMIAAGLISVGSQGIAERRRDNRLADLWSEVADQTGLELEPGSAGIFFRRSGRPRLSGLYRGRQVSISKVVHYESGGPGDDGGMPVAYTNISVRVKNAGGWQLEVRPKPVFKLFNWSGARSGDEELDRGFWFGGRPDHFLQQAVGLIARDPWVLLDRAEEGIKMELKKRELLCVQRGRLTSAFGLLRILNLLCNIAERAEDTRQM